MRRNLTKLLASEASLAEGVQQHLATAASITAADQTMTPAQAIAILKARAIAINANIQARVDWHDAVKKQDAELASTDEFVAGLVLVVRGMYAGAPAILADFGQTPRKVTALTAQQKAEAALKRAATRVARHTMGPKQKAAIKGTVPAPVNAAPATVSSVGAAGTGPGTGHA